MDLIDVAVLSYLRAMRRHEPCEMCNSLHRDLSRKANDTKQAATHSSSLNFVFVNTYLI
jgi:hypothetical protein